MQIVTKNISDLKCPEKNVRLHSDRQIKEYIRSIKMFGQIRPIVVDENDTILCGNGLFQALQQMKRDKAECYVVSNLSDNQKKKIMLVDNKIFELGVNDKDVFDEILEELDGDIDIPGYDEELLKVLTFNAKEADEVLNSYGTFDKTAVERMQRDSTPNVEMVTPQAEYSSKGTVTENTIRQTSQNKQRFVECPKCGEKIWL